MSKNPAPASKAPAKKSWASLAANSASLPAPPAPKVAPAPKKVKPQKKAEYRVPTKINLKKNAGDKSSMPYDRGTPNYRPDKVNIVPNVKEVTERYKIEVDNRLEDVLEPLLSATVETALITAEERMRDAGFCPADDVKALWHEKQRIDSFFDEEQEGCYYKARNSIFPQDTKGSEKFRNRAGDKLWEVHQDIGLFHPEGGVFFDVCGGPGAWSEVMLSDPRKKWSGFGITLRLPNTPISDMWYSHLETADGRWKPLWGVDGTGNIYNPMNLDSARDEFFRERRPVTLVMADGGFHISRNEEGQHMEHLQELYSVRIVLGEMLAFLKCLSANGAWVCKLFDTFSHLTASVVYITGLLFEQTHIIKPFRSRIVNSERYLVGKKMRPRTPALDKLIAHVTKIYAAWDDDIKAGTHPVSLVPPEVMKKDEAFFRSFSASVTDLCHKQTEALKQVMDLAQEYRDQEERTGMRVKI